MRRESENRPNGRVLRSSEGVRGLEGGSGGSRWMRAECRAWWWWRWWWRWRRRCDHETDDAQRTERVEEESGGVEAAMEPAY
jgi:hypothetical protein